jgi:copper chaperone CopZ
VTSTATTSKASAKAVFSLFNLGCSFCSAVIERKLRNLPGIEDPVVNYVTDSVWVNYDPEHLTAEDIRTFIRKLGYEAVVAH